MNVKAFCVVGDGVADDTAALAAALAAAGDAVYLPHGTYRVTSPIIVNRSGLRIIGAGKATRIVGAGSAFTVLQLSGSDIEVAHLSIAHSGIGSEAVADLSVVASHGDDNHLHHLTVENAPHNGSGIRVAGAHRNTVAFNVIRGGGTNSNDISVETFGDDCVVMGNECLSVNKQNGISLGSVTGPATMRRARIVGNHVRSAVNATVAGVAHGIVAISEQTPPGDMTDLIVTGNVIEDIEGHGIYVADGAARALVAGNVLTNCLTNPSGSLMDAAIAIGSTVVAHAPHYSIVRDNIVRGGGASGKHGIRLQNANGAVVQGNTVSETANSIGLRVVGNHMVIAQNIISDTTSSAIWRESGNNAVIQGNVCHDVQSGIEIGGIGDLVTSNRLVGGSEGTGVTVAGERNYLRDNIITGFSIPLNTAGAVNCVVF